MRDLIVAVGMSSVGLLLLWLHRRFMTGHLPAWVDMNHNVSLPPWLRNAPLVANVYGAGCILIGLSAVPRVVLPDHDLAALVGAPPLLLGIVVLVGAAVLCYRCPEALKPAWLLQAEHDEAWRSEKRSRPLRLLDFTLFALLIGGVVLLLILFVVVLAGNLAQRP